MVEAAETRYCYRHPDRETGLSCSDCGRPICTDCATFAPVGIRCPDHSGKPQGVQRVTTGARRASADPAHTFFLAYQDGELIGLCDAKDAPEGEDTFDWCVLVSRHFGGKGVGSTLLDHALTWLHSRGRRYAEYTSTSGLDDYDPLIYLSTIATGAQIRGEFLNLVKNRL